MKRIHDFHHVIRVQLTITTINAIILNESVSHSKMSLQSKEQLSRQINKQMARAHSFSIYKPKTRQSLFISTIFYLLQFAYKYIWLWIEPLATCPYSLLNSHNKALVPLDTKRTWESSKISPESRFHFTIWFHSHYCYYNSFFPTPMIISLWHLPHFCWLSFNVYICIFFQTLCAKNACISSVYYLRLCITSHA